MMEANASVSSIGKADTYAAIPYALAEVEGLSREALDLHLELYKGYVKQVNSLQAQTQKLATRPQLSEAERLQKDGLVRRLAFEFNGMVLHELFFEQLNGHPSGAGPSPGSVLMGAMDISFAGFDGWRKDIAQLAETRGSGWVMSARNADSNRLTNFWIAEHHLGVPAGLRPIAVFDMWEHAYLLDFAPSARRDYLSVLFRNLDWSVLELRCLPK